MHVGVDHAAGLVADDARSVVRTRQATVDRLTAIAANLDALIGLREAAAKALFEQELRRDELGALVALGAAEIASLAARVDQRATRLQKARAGHRSIRQRRQTGLA